MAEFQFPYFSPGRKAKTKLENLRVLEVSLVGMGDNPGAHAILAKMKADGGTSKMAIDLSKLDDEVIKVIETATKTADEATTQLEKVNGELKAATEAIAKADARIEELEKAPQEGTPNEETEENSPEIPEELQKALTDKNAQIMELQKSVASMVEKARRSELAAVAKNYEGVGKSHEELTDILVAADKSGQLEAVEGAFKIATEALRKSKALEAVGASGQVSGATEAYARMEARAEELRKADSGLSREGAIAQVMKLHPELYKEYLDEIS